MSGIASQARYTLPVFLTTLVVGKLDAIIFLPLRRYSVRGLMSGAVR